MNRYIIFYAGSKYNDSFIVEAESLNEAFKIAQSFCCAHRLSLLGIIDKTCYSKIHPHE